MAGPYTMQQSYSNGKMLHLYIAANQPVGVGLPAMWNSAPAATTQSDFSVDAPCFLTDVISNEVSGNMELINVTESRATGLKLGPITVARYAATVPTRQVPRIGLRPGYIYRWIFDVVGGA